MGIKWHLSDSAQGACKGRGGVRGAELSHRVWGKGSSAHSDLQGWREGKRKHILAVPRSRLPEGGAPCSQLHVKLSSGHTRSHALT